MQKRGMVCENPKNQNREWDPFWLKKMKIVLNKFNLEKKIKKNWFTQFFFFSSWI